ncbi:kinase [Clostridia bacterium]|nr:kinase [Clostridia bacterium]
MRGGIAIAGDIVADNIKVIDSYPKPGCLSSILSIGKSTGGNVPNMTIDLKLLDPLLTVRAVGLVGGDDNGAYTLAQMRRAGVDVGGVRTIAESYTAFSDVMTVQGTGERTFFHGRGANSLFAPEHIDFNAIADCGIFHLAYALLLDSMDAPDPDYGTVMARTLAEARRRGFVTSMDVVSENGDRFAAVVTPSLKYSDYVIINELEASLVTSIPARNGDGIILPDNIPHILRKLMDGGVGRLVCVHAPEGAWALENNGKLWHRHSLKLPEGWVKGTVGAGDAFCAGMLYSLQRGWDICKAMDIGAAAAACVLHQQDGFGVKTIDELERMAAEFSTN